LLFVNLKVTGMLAQSSCRQWNGDRHWARPPSVLEDPIVQPSDTAKYRADDQSRCGRLLRKDKG
jgi:hypothetical protein